LYRGLCRGLSSNIPDALYRRNQMVVVGGFLGASSESGFIYGTNMALFVEMITVQDPGFL
jgi:hypothetical protein